MKLSHGIGRSLRNVRFGSSLNTLPWKLSVANLEAFTWKLSCGNLLAEPATGSREPATRSQGPEAGNRRNLLVGPGRTGVNQGRLAPETCILKILDKNPWMKWCGQPTKTGDAVVRATKAHLPLQLFQHTCDHYNHPPSSL